MQLGQVSHLSSWEEMRKDDRMLLQSLLHMLDYTAMLLEMRVSLTLRRHVTRAHLREAIVLRPFFAYLHISGRSTDKHC